jgi:hypothetical protein
LTEEGFIEKVNEMSGNMRGLDIVGFDKLLDDLVSSYYFFLFSLMKLPQIRMGQDYLKVVGERRKSLLGEDFKEGSVASLPEPPEDSGTEALTDSEEEEEKETGGTDEDDDDGDLEVDIERSFEFLSEGKSYVTESVSVLLFMLSQDLSLLRFIFSFTFSAKAIRNWDLIQYLLRTGRLSEVDLNRTLTSILLSKKNQFALHNFRQCMDEVLMLCGFNMEGYESRLGTDYGEGGEDTEMAPSPEYFEEAQTKQPIELPPDGSGEKKFIIPYC